MSSKVYIIAEAGVNHNGSLLLAKQLVDAAVLAGADAVKFQSFIAQDEISTYANKANYQLAHTEKEESQLEMVRKLELSWQEQKELLAYCNQKGIDFLSTPFEIKSLRFLAQELQLTTLKISSGDITAAPILLEAARLQKKVIMSTGMANLGEIEDALGVLAFGYCHLEEPLSAADFRKAYLAAEGRAALHKNVSLMHCTTEYPAPYEEVNLQAMVTLRQAFHLPVGLSDHTRGIAIPVAAVALGACMIEKHFTLDASMEGPDHKASLEPAELRSMVQGIRQVEAALGTGLKIPSPSEHANIKVARKSLVALKEIEEGEEFTKENLGYKRPGDGITPMKYWEILKKKAKKRYFADEVVRDEDQL